jgi:hypothetical protein
MEWTLTNLWIQIVAGILGGHAAAAATKEYSFGALGHTLAGMIVAISCKQSSRPSSRAATA